MQNGDCSFKNISRSKLYSPSWSDIREPKSAGKYKQGGNMATTVGLLLACIVPIVAGLKQNVCNPDIASITNHMTRIEQQVETLQNALLSQIQTSNDKIADLQKQVTALSHNNGLRVAFQTLLQLPNITVENLEYLKFNSTMNIGGGYNKHTGVFTVPKTGVYIFWANIVGADTNFFEINLVKNGKDVVGGYTGKAVYNSMFYGGTASFLYMSYFQKGDTLVFQNNHRYVRVTLDGNRFSGYGGILIG